MVHIEVFGQLGRNYEFFMLPQKLGTLENSWEIFSRMFRNISVVLGFFCCLIISVRFYGLKKNSFLLKILVTWKILMLKNIQEIFFPDAGKYLGSFENFRLPTKIIKVWNFHFCPKVLGTWEKSWCSKIVGIKSARKIRAPKKLKKIFTFAQTFGHSEKNPGAWKIAGSLRIFMVPDNFR